ncbi:MAG: VTT domain-containing protein [Candidatus Nealsonbacteria bacterium]|nr:VTT domain-containing protein [Candidatus Nealsonbacteria bacterium]
MIENFITYIQSIISQYGAWGVFLATLIEEIIAPVPSPIVPLAAGFFLLPTSVSFTEIVLRGAFTIALPVSIGITIGSTLVYALGFFGGKPVIEKSKKWTGINWDDIEKSEARFTRGKGDEISLFVLRVLPIIPGVAISGFCGVVRYQFKKFIIITSLGAFVRAFVLGLVGWQVGELYVTYADMISKFEKYVLSVVFFLLLLSFLGYYIRKKIKARRM